MGDIVIVEPGNVLDTDGVLLSGGLEVDESCQTGEPKLQRKEPDENGSCFLKAESKAIKGIGKMMVLTVRGRRYRYRCGCGWDESKIQINILPIKSYVFFIFYS